MEVILIEKKLHIYNVCVYSNSKLVPNVGVVVFTPSSYSWLGLGHFCFIFHFINFTCLGKYSHYYTLTLEFTHLEKKES